MSKEDKRFVTWLCIIIIVVLNIFYYLGEERSRKFEKEGFVVCNIKGRDTWVKSCKEGPSIFQKVIGEFK